MTTETTIKHVHTSKRPGWKAELTAEECIYSDPAGVPYLNLTTSYNGEETSIDVDVEWARFLHGVIEQWLKNKEE